MITVQPNNINEQKLNEMLLQASKKLGVPPEELKSKLQNGVIPNSKSSIDLQSLINDKDAINKMLQNPKAQELIKKLMNGKK